MVNEYATIIAGLINTRKLSYAGPLLLFAIALVNSDIGLGLGISQHLGPFLGAREHVAKTLPL